MHHPHPKPDLAADAGTEHHDAAASKPHSLQYKGCAQERRTDQVIFHIASILPGDSVWAERCREVK